MNAYVVVIAAGLVSYLCRVSMLVLSARRALPPAFERAARFAVPTAFAALAAASVASSVSDGEALAPILAVVAAAVTVRRTGTPHTALLAGMPVLWLASAVLAR
jgi:branched-subunit amino acid transport protein